MARYLYPIFLIRSFLLSYSLLAQDQSDSIRTIQLENVVITASRLKEDIHHSPVTIERMTLAQIEQSASPSFFDALESLKGVQMLTPSLGFKVINTRGFANTTNVRFAQLVDGMDTQAPHLGGPIANALGPNDLDIERVEITPGVASALYGMNAINGLAHFITKDPFQYTGLSIQQKVGFNRVNRADGAKPFTETNIRWSAIIHPKVAFKLNGTFLKGTDWIANNETDLNASANASTGLTGNDNPAYDAVNGYGNESSNRRTLSLNGKNYVVARTGYHEADVVDYGIQNFKTDAALHYAIRPGATVNYFYRFAHLDNVYQRSNRFRLDNYQLQQHGLAFHHRSIQARVYLNRENTGKSYNARSMAENIDKSFKSDDLWFADYSSQFKNAIASGISLANAHQEARLFADAGRPQPGTIAFRNQIDQLKEINDWNYGAALRVKSSMVHAEGQVNLTEQWLSSWRKNADMTLLMGAEHRTYVIVPDGNYFINPTEAGRNIVYAKTSVFLQTSKSIWDEKIKIGATLRADKNQYYSLKWNPRLTLVFTPTVNHVFRSSYQTGYRFPSVFEAFSNVNSGGVKRVGGLPIMSTGIFEQAYNRASIDAFQSAVNTDVNKGGLTKDDAIIKNKNVLIKNDYTYVQPEHIRSLEAGYRSAWLNDKLQWDIDFYFNTYTQFIAQVEMNIPKTNNTDSIAFYLVDKKKQDRYRMWTNSKTTAYNYGGSMGLTYAFFSNFKVMANTTFARLKRRSTNDGLEDGFNSPAWITNFAISNDRVFRSFGFMIFYHWQSAYYWQSFLVNGQVPSYQTVDAQVSYSCSKVKLKLGGTNLLNHYYYSYLGGPFIGGFYYSSITANL